MWSGKIDLAMKLILAGKSKRVTGFAKIQKNLQGNFILLILKVRTLLWTECLRSNPGTIAHLALE